ncbi:MAG: imidazoleglycerol-phosphate dehydratase HisB [Acidobacteria bacterium]|nr:imidazoleglycerol-phosphate dehydratase HisB [Acidobacteriota bacterium]
MAARIDSSGRGRSHIRKAHVERNTTETQIQATLTLEGKGRYDVHTGIHFLDHMLELFAKHGGFDLKLRAKGDLDVDQHHTVEDVGIVLGQCFREALGDRRGINRAGYFLMPLDEALAVVAVDLSGRPYLVCNVPLQQPKVGDLQTELIEDFFQGFATHVGANVHLRLLYGRSTHHSVEAIFKTFARAMKMAVSLDSRLKKELPSTKGLL